jgi:hypothetical protein
MKSIAKILLTTIVIMLCSCQQPDTSTARPIDSNVPPIAHRFTFEGHSYIGFKYERTYSITIIHDPDCECNKKQENH